MRPKRRVLPGSTYLITKKCADDRFVTVPSDSVNEVLLYCLLASADRYGIQLHAFCFMSNHFHLVLTDPEGRLPDFMSHFLTNSSKALKVTLGWRDSVWSRDRYSSVHLLDRDAVRRKILYTLLNPTLASLVAHPAAWPGVTSAGYSMGSFMRCSRPRFYFGQKRTCMPESVEVVLSPPVVGVEARCAQVEQREIDGLLATALNIVLLLHRRRGRAFLGREAILRVSRRRQSSHPVRTRRPRFSSRDPERLRSAIAEDRAFQLAHDDAKRRYISGEVEVEFPSGTYGYRRLLDVVVEQAAA